MILIVSGVWLYQWPLGRTQWMLLKEISDGAANWVLQRLVMSVWSLSLWLCLNIFVCRCCYPLATGCAWAPQWCMILAFLPNTDRGSRALLLSLSLHIPNTATFLQEVLFSSVVVWTNHGDCSLPTHLRKQGSFLLDWKWGQIYPRCWLNVGDFWEFHSYSDPTKAFQCRCMWLRVWQVLFSMGGCLMILAGQQLIDPVGHVKLAFYGVHGSFTACTQPWCLCIHGPDFNLMRVRDCISTRRTNRCVMSMLQMIMLRHICFFEGVGRVPHSRMMTIYDLGLECLMSSDREVIM